MSCVNLNQGSKCSMTCRSLCILVPQFDSLAHPRQFFFFFFFFDKFECARICCVIGEAKRSYIM